MHKITRAVIPAAGWGTRWLPATHRVPKELMPLMDAPIIQWVVEEALDSGLTDVALVIAPQKKQVLEHFVLNTDLDGFLRAHGKADWLEGLKQLLGRVRVTAVLQTEARGLGHAIGCAREWVSGEACAVLLPDEVVLRTPSQRPCTSQLVELFLKHGKSVIALMKMPEQELHKYGVASVSSTSQSGLWNVAEVVEKPKSAPPSLLALPGRYVFTHEVFEHLKKIEPQENREIQLTDALTTLGKQNRLLGTEFEGHRFDAGDRMGWIEANVWLAMQQPEYQTELRRRITPWLA